MDAWEKVIIAVVSAASSPAIIALFKWAIGFGRRKEYLEFAQDVHIKEVERLNEEREQMRAEHKEEVKLLKSEHAEELQKLRRQVDKLEKIVDASYEESIERNKRLIEHEASLLRKDVTIETLRGRIEELNGDPGRTKANPAD